jgi:hypothetical protein
MNRFHPYLRDIPERKRGAEASRRVDAIISKDLKEKSRVEQSGGRLLGCKSADVIGNP